MMTAAPSIASAEAAAVEQGARDARFAALLEVNAPALRRLAASYTRNSSDRDDLLQDIAIALWQALPRFRGESSERTFLFRIAHNRCLSFIARRRNFVPLDEPGVDEPADLRPTPEAALGAAQDAARLMRGLQSLPMIYREVLVLALEDMDYRDIAQVLGISANNVGVRLNRARTLLRAWLGNER